MYYFEMHSGWFGFCGDTFAGDEATATAAAQEFAARHGLTILRSHKLR